MFCRRIASTFCQVELICCRDVGVAPADPESHFSLASQASSPLIVLTLPHPARARTGTPAERLRQDDSRIGSQFAIASCTLDIPASLRPCHLLRSTEGCPRRNQRYDAEARPGLLSSSSPYGDFNSRTRFFQFSKSAAMPRPFSVIQFRHPLRRAAT